MMNVEIRGGERLMIMKSARKLLYLTILAAILALPSVSAALAATPTVNFSVQSIAPVGIWFGGTILSDGTTRGAGSICHVEDEFGGALGIAEVYQVRGATNLNSWNPNTGTLTLYGIFTNPKTRATLGPIPLVITGLIEGHNEVTLFGGRHIIEINTIP